MNTTTLPQTTSNLALQSSTLTHNFENQLKLNVANSSSSTINERQANHFASHIPTTTAHPSSHFTILNDQLRATEFQATTGNGYQKLPPFRATQATTSIDHNDVVDHHMLGHQKLNNRLYTQSPQLPRKVYNDVSNQQQHYSPHHHLHQIPMQHQMHMGRESPFMQRKFPPQEIGGNYSPYKPLPMQQNSSISPMTRRRYQENSQTVVDEEYRILHGNTSPIVLQRFYHQQNQLRERAEQEQMRNEMRMNSASPFKNSPSHTSSIPRPGGSPLPNYRYQQQQQHQHHPSMIANRYQQQHDAIPNFHHASHIPQLQGRYVSNGNGTIKHQQQVVYDNLAHRPQIPCPGSPQLDRLRANMEKANFYDRHQKLPIESSYQLEMNRHNNGDLHHTDAKNKDKGENFLSFSASPIVLACFKFFNSIFQKH